MFGCIAAVVLNCILGTIWYSGKLPMGRLWMKRTHPGKSESDIAKENGFAMGFSVITSIVMSLLLRFILIDFLHAYSWIDAIKFGIGLSCLTTLLELPHVLFAKGYFDVFLLHQIYNLLAVVGSALSIVYLKKFE